MRHYAFFLIFGSLRGWRLFGLFPGDRNRLTDECNLQQLFHSGDRTDLKSALHIVRYLREILLIFRRDDDGLETGAERCQQLLLESADGEYPSAERNFARHCDVALHRYSRQQRDNRGCHGHAGRGAVLGRRPFGHVDVNILTVKQGRLDAEGKRPRTREGARRVDRYA